MIAGLAAACSADVSRFDADPFANPFRSRGAYDPVVTNSTNRQAVPPAAIDQPLPPPGQATTATLPPPSQPLITGSINPAPRSAGSVASANYPALAPSAPRAGATALSGSTGWTAAGGTPVTLQPGENLATLSNRYGVPVNALMAVNGFSNASQPQPGQQVVIPAYNPVSAGKPAAGAQATSAIARPRIEAAKIEPKKVAELRQPIPAAPKAADIRAAAPKIEPPKIEPPKIDAAKPARQVIAARETEAEKRAAAKLREATATQTRSVADLKAKMKPVDEDVETTASIAAPKLPPKAAPMVAKVESPKGETEKPVEAASAESAPDFRWPAKGRVISGFGARGTGGANDGINIALPEGTPVRAAEGGTVVHADDALKGYGKLVLIRHANGYVSVYAHNSDLKVKRGESVKRGQVIATSGQTGNVTAPQLHFEIRKGATPVDPGKYLGG
jgi:murein DD-endopeptidase MepM/ murein hydrolase activator NlpD